MPERPLGAWKDGQLVVDVVVAMVEKAYQDGFARGLRASRPTCESCTHWGVHDPYQPEKGACSVLKDDAAYEQNTAVYVKVSYGYPVDTFSTHKDFGCALHEARPSEDEVIRDADH